MQHVKNIKKKFQAKMRQKGLINKHIKSNKLAAILK